LVAQSLFPQPGLPPPAERLAQGLLFTSSRKGLPNQRAPIEPTSSSDNNYDEDARMIATAVAVKPSTISLSEAARELNLPEETLKRWVKAGLLSTVPSYGTEDAALLLDDIAELQRMLPPV
jgi:hypothetical protein